MFKEQLLKTTLELIDTQRDRLKKQAETVIPQLSDEQLAEYPANYFAPKAFLDALIDCNTEHVDSRGFTLGFVRKYKKAVNTFISEIIQKR